MKWCVGLVALLITTPALAQNNVSTGNGFWAQCGHPADGSVGLACSAYVRGLHDSLMHPGANQRAICLPAGFTYQQGQDMLLKELADNPESRHLPTAGIYAGVLWSAFTCLRSPQR